MRHGCEKRAAVAIEPMASLGEAIRYLNEFIGAAMECRFASYLTQGLLAECHCSISLCMVMVLDVMDRADDMETSHVPLHKI